jgi:hypothetical protein
MQLIFAKDGQLLNVTRPTITTISVKKVVNILKDNGFKLIKGI